MCNPNSSALAYRRQRAMALVNTELEPTGVSKPRSSGIPQSFTASLLLQKSGVQSYNMMNDVAIHFSPPPPPSTAASNIIGKHEFIHNEELFRSLPSAVSSFQYSNFPDKSIEPPKRKPKRRRKPQKPGKTAKQNDRHFVVHNYHDHANDCDDQEVEEPEGGRRRGGVSISFPQKLHSVLDQVERDGLAHVVAWQPHGRCFVIHKPKEFTEHIMPHYFRQSKLTSFQRQLNLYGFNRITRGNDAGGYYHELFLRGKDFLCKRMMRTKVKGTKFKAASSPDEEPDFYKMPPVIVTPVNSDCDESDNGHQVDHDHNCSGTLYTTQEAPFQASIGDPERYHSYQIPVSSSPYQHTAELGDALPLPYSNSSAPMLSCAMRSQRFEIPESPRLVVSSPQTNGMGHAHGVLDQAVDELFLGEGGVPPPEVNDSIVDFVNCWDPSSYGPDAALENDTQLGNLLDKLLWAEF